MSWLTLVPSEQMKSFLWAQYGKPPVLQPKLCIILGSSLSEHLHWKKVMYCIMCALGQFPFQKAWEFTGKFVVHHAVPSIHFFDLSYPGWSAIEVERLDVEAFDLSVPFPVSDDFLLVVTKAPVHLSKFAESHHSHDLLWPRFYRLAVITLTSGRAATDKRQKPKLEIKRWISVLALRKYSLEECKYYCVGWSKTNAPGPIFSLLRELITLGR